MKQLFHALVNRTEAYSFPHAAGLMLFGSEVKHACPLTSYLDGAPPPTLLGASCACADAMRMR